MHATLRILDLQQWGTSMNTQRLLSQSFLTGRAAIDEQNHLRRSTLLISDSPAYLAVSAILAVAIAFLPRPHL